MPFIRRAMPRILPLVAVLFAATCASAQSGNAGAIRGAVTDPSGAVVSGATVVLTNELSGFDRTTTTDATGQFTFSNVPFNPYRIDVTAKGFAHLSQDVEIRSSLGSSVKLVLQIAGASQTVTVVSGGDLIEDDPTFHVDVDRDLFNKVPLESASSTLSSLVTLTTPGVAADSNGLFHGLGDHASNSFSVDGQSITDQQSKVFSNQLPIELHSVHRGHQRRASGRIRRQNQPRHRGHHALRPGRHQAYRRYLRFLRSLRVGNWRLRSLLRRQELGQLH